MAKNGWMAINSRQVSAEKKDDEKKIIPSRVFTFIRLYCWTSMDQNRAQIGCQPHRSDIDSECTHTNGLCVCVCVCTEYVHGVSFTLSVPMAFSVELKL